MLHTLCLYHLDTLDVSAIYFIYFITFGEMLGNLSFCKGAEAEAAFSPQEGTQELLVERVFVLYHFNLMNGGRKSQVFVHQCLPAKLYL